MPAAPTPSPPGGLSGGLAKAREAPDVAPDADGDDAAVELDVSSVITQVSAPPKWAPGGEAREREGERPGSWRHRVRNLLCCFAPAGPGGFKGDLSLGGGNPYAALPPQPPRVYREAVIGAKRAEDSLKKTLVLDLDETLVHSSFKPIPNPDYIIPVEIDGRLVDVYVLKRPWLDHFMATVGPRFEVVVFTASLAKYADPLLDLMDKGGLVRWRLFRESCVPYEGNYVKDLNCLGRDLCSTIIVDNSPHSYIFQPANAVPIGTFIDDMEDQELLELLPQLLQVESVDDVRPYLGPNFATQEAAQQAAAAAAFAQAQQAQLNACCAVR
ncbi:CTDSP1 [Scenedesmus sp. PABB004]|nr:CTDSP1 [Scenedesmus sp. PABB004]